MMHPWLEMDPYVLVSLINMKLRNFYEDLDGLCEDLGIERPLLEEVLSGIGYRYDRLNNHFTDADIAV